MQETSYKEVDFEEAATSGKQNIVAEKEQSL